MASITIQQRGITQKNYMYHTHPSSLYLFADPDGGPAPTSYHVGQQFVRLGLLAVVFDGMVQMLQLLVSYPSQVLDQDGQLFSQRLPSGLQLIRPVEQHAHLLVVVRANLCLDGLGAGHGSLPAQDGGAPAQDGGSGAPHGVHGGGPYAVLREQAVEVVEVAGLLVVHVLHQRAQMGVRAQQRRRLRRVDQDGGQLAGLVHAQGRVEEVALRLGQVFYGQRCMVGVGGRGLRYRSGGCLGGSGGLGRVRGRRVDSRFLAGGGGGNGTWDESVGDGTAGGAGGDAGQLARARERGGHGREGKGGWRAMSAYCCGGAE